MNSDETLLLAAKNGDDQAIKRAIRQGANVNYKSGDILNRRTPVIVAVEYGHLSSAKLLIDNKADVNAGVPKNDDFLYRDEERILFLIENGFNVKFWVACSKGCSLPVVKKLIHKGERMGGLYWACEGGRPEVVDYLISVGFECRNSFIDMRNGEVANILIKAGYDINSLMRNDLTPDPLIALLEAKAEIDFENYALLDNFYAFMYLAPVAKSDGQMFRILSAYGVRRWNLPPRYRKSEIININPDMALSGCPIEIIDD